MHEVLDYDFSEQYDKETKTGGLFTAYINTFLRLKQEAERVEGIILVLQYADVQYISLGVLLDKAKIEKNAGLRAMAKLMLNSFWGKFGQRKAPKQCRQFNFTARRMLGPRTKQTTTSWRP